MNCNVFSLTARISVTVKILSSCFLNGTIMMRKKGKASENREDFTIHKTISART